MRATEDVQECWDLQDGVHRYVEIGKGAGFVFFGGRMAEGQRDLRR